MRPMLQLAAMMAGLGLLAGCAGPSDQLHFGKVQIKPPSGPVGPTLHLDYGRTNTVGNLIGEFMYFVPLISPEPVSMIESTNNTQRARVVSFQQHVTADSFSGICEFEITGAGSQWNIFDHTNIIRRNERQLKAGGLLERQLGYIRVDGAGHGSIEMEGVVTNEVPTVTGIRLRFNGHGHSSPVSIGLHDLREVDGAIRTENEMVGRVNTLTFRRPTVRPQMEVSLASVQRDEAGSGLWQKFLGNVVGAAANLLIKPISVEPTGHAAMLDFGLALVAEKPAFTFPRAKNLKSDSKAPGS